jgi:hypothetical protein
VGEGKEVWGVGKIANSILPNRTEAGETDRPAGMEARRRPWPRRRSGGWGKTKGGDEGVLPRSYLGLGCAGGVDRWSAVGCKRRWPGTALAAAMESSGEEEMVVEVRGATGSRAGPLYRREKAVRGGQISPPTTGGGGAAARSIREDSRRGRRGSVWDSRCGAVGYDPSCRWLGNGGNGGGVAWSAPARVVVTDRAG